MSIGFDNNGLHPDSFNIHGLNLSLENVQKTNISEQNEAQNTKTIKDMTTTAQEVDEAVDDFDFGFESASKDESNETTAVENQKSKDEELEGTSQKSLGTSEKIDSTAEKIEGAAEKSEISNKEIEVKSLVTNENIEALTSACTNMLNDEAVQEESKETAAATLENLQTINELDGSPEELANVMKNAFVDVKDEDGNTKPFSIHDIIEKKVTSGQLKRKDIPDFVDQFIKNNKIYKFENGEKKELNAEELKEFKGKLIRHLTLVYDLHELKTKEQEDKKKLEQKKQPNNSQLSASQNESNIKQTKKIDPSRFAIIPDGIRTEINKKLIQAMIHAFESSRTAEKRYIEREKKDFELRRTIEHIMIKLEDIHFRLYKASTEKTDRDEEFIRLSQQDYDQIESETKTFVDSKGALFEAFVFKHNIIRLNASSKSLN